MLSCTVIQIEGVINLFGGCAERVWGLVCMMFGRYLEDVLGGNHLYTQGSFVILLISNSASVFIKGQRISMIPGSEPMFLDLVQLSLLSYSMENNGM